jgi:glycogen(starch) synthase
VHTENPAVPSSLRITQLVLSNAFAGTEAHVAQLSEFIVSRGAVVRLICGDQNLELLERGRSAGVSMDTLRLGRGNLPVDWPAAHRAIAGWGPHIIHAHLGSSLLAGALLSTAPQRKLVFTQHFVRPAYLDDAGLRAQVRLFGHRLIHHRVDHAVTTTEIAKKEMIHVERFPAHRTSVVPLGIDIAMVQKAAGNKNDVRLELGIPAHSPLIITPARLEREKGHTTLLDCIPPLLARHSNVHLLVAGQGSMELELKDYARSLGIDSNVHFLGRRRDVHRLLAQATVCALPSYCEPFGIVLLEAMAVGVPVVASTGPGPSAIVLDGETGLLVPPRGPEALADAIGSLLSAPDRAIAMGKQGRTRVQEKFSVRTMGEQMLDLYQRVRAAG